MNRHLAFFSLISGLVSCASAPEGLRETPAGTGPEVHYDWDAQPLPEIPFPNDLATRPDPGSVTGLRLNISEEAVTHAESEARVKLNELVGFGIFSPIAVQFNDPLDLDNVVARHPNDFHIDGGYDDDAFYVINIDPDSADFGKPFPLDVGHGRFPMDAARSDRYFPNDTRSDEPSVVFDTVDEDVNGNGILDWGEDTDNDGILDVPNVYPEGGAPRDDLLTWYERATDTLMFRPVVPLLEETTYAVVLTDRLVGEGGEPVRSPWKYVNHTRQTEALRPLVDALPPLGMTMDDVAFAWTFTTGRVTGDLVDIHRGLFDAEGPWPFLSADYPAGVTEALQMHEQNDKQHDLPMAILLEQLINLGLFDGPEAIALQDAYLSFADRIVGGTIEVPYLLADRDDGGRDDSDEWWQLDPVAGTLHAESQRVAFTCVLPRADMGFEAPYDVAMFGHGYGSSRFDFLGFSYGLNRVGMASCAMDFPGHGPTLGVEEEALVELALEAQDLTPFLLHLKDSRYRDLNNDGVADSGGDQWSADPFHTRDMVRQAAVDWMQMVRSFQACGVGEMALTEYEDDATTTPTGDSLMTCDWDDDGTPDMGGEDARYFIVGGSLGGINSAVAAGVIPEVTAWAPIVPGGGTLDIGIRTEIGGAVEAMFGRLVSPMFLGYPQEDGSLQVVQMVNSVTDMETLAVDTLPSIPAGGRIRVENLDNGQVREGYIPEDGRFRVSIAADGLDAAEKREITGMPETGAGDGIWSVPNNEGLGDRFVVEFFDADDTLVATLDQFAADVTHEGVTMPAGSPLVAGSHGNGTIRAHPDMRRLAWVIAAALEPGDAISYAPLWNDRPSEELGGEKAHVLVMPTAGDSIVSVNTGIALARAAGLVPFDEIDDRYGTTVDQWLIDRRVVQGLEQYGPYRNEAGEPVLFDIDDADRGSDGFEAPSDAPLRSTRTEDSGVTALRMPYVSPRGTHGFTFPNPTLDFDVASYSLNQVAWFFATGGQEVSDDPCLGTRHCDFLTPFRETDDGGAE
jgi:hypothetical protein